MKTLSITLMINEKSTAMRLFGICLFLAIPLVASVAQAKPLLVLHLDFNTIQMRKETVVGCLREAARMGYNAVLWEVEDKIRWETCPECVHPEAFSKDEFRGILNEARRLNLEPIPLLQTFGHAEYVLMNGGHGDWMEDPEFPACYCVSKPEVRTFLRRMVSEYLELFGNDVRHFHLGGDEAKAFCTCPVCSRRERMELYAEHLRFLAEPLLRYNIKPGIWCDMVLGDADAFRKANLPRSFTVWHWDYVYDGKGKKRAWTDRLDVLEELGHDVVFTVSSSSAGDGPFLPRYGAHMDNVAASAELVRRKKMLGLCVTSWSVRKFPKALQLPIWDFVAKRLLDPSADCAADEAAAYQRYFGLVHPRLMRSLTEWDGDFVMMDASGWVPYIKHARPAPEGTFDREVRDEFRRNPQHRNEVLAKTAKIGESVRMALSAFERFGTDGSESETLKEGVSLALTFLDEIHTAYAGGVLGKLPVSETADYYRKEQPEISATNAATVAWSVLGGRVAVLPAVAEGVLCDHSEPVGLPDLMRNNDGSRVSDVHDWETVRRKEILDFLSRHVYGLRPVERPADLCFEPLEPDRVMLAGKAVRKRVRISFSGPRGNWSFNACAFLPAGADAAKPVPAFLLMCNRDLDEYANVDRTAKSEFFPVEEIVARGYAAVVFRNTELAKDDYLPRVATDGTATIQDPPFTNGFYTCWAPCRGENSWGAISVWAWGCSRVMDWLETIPGIDARRVAVVGHSRGGKTSLWAGATDTRFALTCVNDSGCCGAKLNHVAMSRSETIRLDNDYNPHWFCRAFRQFNGQDACLPYDQHWVAALVAPRLLYISSAHQDTGAGPWAEFQTAKEASSAWNLYGCEGLVIDGPYAVESRFQMGCIGYHLRRGNHDLKAWDWRNFMDFADRHMNAIRNDR